jgi:hypothetical protein
MKLLGKGRYYTKYWKLKEHTCCDQGNGLDCLGSISGSTFKSALGITLPRARAVAQVVFAASFSPRMPDFAPRSARVGFAVDKVALRQVLSWYFGFHVSVPFHRRPICSHMPPGGWVRAPWRPQRHSVTPSEQLGSGRAGSSPLTAASAEVKNVPLTPSGSDA